MSLDIKKPLLKACLSAVEENEKGLFGGLLTDVTALPACNIRMKDGRLYQIQVIATAAVNEFMDMPVECEVDYESQRVKRTPVEHKVYFLTLHKQIAQRAFSGDEDAEKQLVELAKESGMYCEGAIVSDVMFMLKKAWKIVNDAAVSFQSSRNGFALAGRKELRHV